MSTPLHQLRPRLDAAPWRTLTGLFHSHVTVRTTPAALDGLRAVCRQHHAKATVIDLRGVDDRTQRDVMATRYHHDDDEGALGRIADELAALCEALSAAGLEPVRVKVEHESLPSLATYDDDHYHEVHIKLRLPEHAYEVERAWLDARAPELGWRASRNPYERREGTVVQFVTLRCYDGDRAAADARVSTVLGVLAARGLEVAEVKRETTVLDTASSHDRWWVGP